MAVVGPCHQLDRQPQRIVVAGTSGSGKTTLARKLSTALEIPHIEIDGLYHGPNWTKRPMFGDDVDSFMKTDSWVTEWQHSEVRGRLAERAELMVWLDLPRHVVLRQVVGRTLRRRVRGEVLWNGNVEPPLRTIFTNREHTVRWAWTTHSKGRLRVFALAEGRSQLPIVQIRSHAEADRWISGLATHRFRTIDTS